MTDKHEWPTAPIIQATWVTPMTEETALIGTWTRVRDGVYYSTYRGYVARKGEGHFTDVTEYWPRDYLKDEVQRLQRALRERNITIAALREELEELEEQPDSPCCESDPTTFVFPHEPEGPIWDKNGNKWVSIYENTWGRTNDTGVATWLGLLEKLGPLTTTPPDNQAWRIGDTINTPEEADTLPGKTIIHDNRQYYAQKYKNQWFGPGHPYAIEASIFEYPLTILWLPEEGKA